MKISIKQCDITNLEVDAIVNAAHSALMGGGGVDGAIHRKAGAELLSECMTIKQDENGVRCHTGEAHITKAYNLPSKYVIHTVAPKFVGGLIRRVVDGKPTPVFTSKTLNEDNLLMELCYENCMKLAEINSVKTIAFPSLGTGGHAYPIEIACPIAINTVTSFLNISKSVEEVIFVCFSDNDYEFYQNAYAEFRDKTTEGNKTTEEVTK